MDRSRLRGHTVTISGCPHKRERSTFAEDEPVVVVGPEHPWLRRRGWTTAAELATAALIAREQGSGTRDTFERALRRTGHLHGPARLELASTAAIKSAMLAGQGIGVLSRLAVNDDVANGRLHTVPIHGIDLRRKLRVVYRSGTRLVGPVAELASCAVGSLNDTSVARGDLWPSVATGRAESTGQRTITTSRWSTKPESSSPNAASAMMQPSRNRRCGLHTGTGEQ